MSIFFKTDSSQLYLILKELPVVSIYLAGYTVNSETYVYTSLQILSFFSISIALPNNFLIFLHKTAISRLAVIQDPYAILPEWVLLHTTVLPCGS